MAAYAFESPFIKQHPDSLSVGFELSIGDVNTTLLNIRLQLAQANGATKMEQVIDREWPHIGWALRLHPSRGGYQYDMWACCADKLGPAERAAGYEEWAAYVEFELAQMANELASDPAQRHILETLTDSMAYTFRRLAAYARGDDPGEAVPQHQRRPDLVAARLAHLNDSASLAYSA